MSDFDVEAQSLNSSRSKYDLLNSFQLQKAIDSFNLKLDLNSQNTAYNFDELLAIKVNEEEENNKETKKSNLPASVTRALVKKDKQVSENKVEKKANTKKPNSKGKKQIKNIDLTEVSSFLETFKTTEAEKLNKTAKFKIQKTGDTITKTKRENELLTRTRARYILRFHQQFSWALICIVFLFIGAPLGSIVRKGGYGFPLLIAIIFFMMFIVLNIMGEKLNRTGEISPILAAWLPNLILIPVAIYISYKALNDSTFSNPFKKIIRRM